MGAALIPRAQPRSALFAVAILAPAPLAAAALVAIGLLLVWLTFLAWPALGLGGKAMRLVMVGLVVILDLTRC